MPKKHEQLFGLKIKATKAVFSKRYQNATLNEIFDEKPQNEKREIPPRFLPVIKDFESEEDK